MSPTVRRKADFSPRKILLLRLRRLGDIVLTTPAITLLKKSFPDASLTYLVEEPFRRLVEGNPHLDRVLTVPVKQKTADLLRLIRSIRRERYDVLLDFHGGPRTSWITLLSAARLKVGYAIKTKGFLYDIRVPRSGESGPVHSVENHANLVKVLIRGSYPQLSTAEPDPRAKPGAPAVALGSVEFPFVDIPPLFLPEPTEAEKARVRALLAEERLGALTRDVNARLSAAETDPQTKSGAPAAAPSLHSSAEISRGPSAREPDPQAKLGAPALVVLHVGAGNRFRDWGADNLAALASLLIREGKARVALIGTEGDRAVEERIRAASPAGTLPFSGRLNLMETRELIRLAALFAGPDSGPMHIAASTPTPIVAWFGPTLPANFAPWRPDRGRTVILERMLPCRPCEQRACVTDDFRCLQELSPSEVFEACRPFLL